MKCNNCRFIKYDWYNDNKCTCPSNTSIEYDGSYNKIYKTCSELNPNYNCKNFKPDFMFKIKMFIGKIQGIYYKRKYPEWFL